MDVTNYALEQYETHEDYKPVVLRLNWILNSRLGAIFAGKPVYVVPLSLGSGKPCAF